MDINYTDYLLILWGFALATLVYHWHDIVIWWKYRRHHPKALTIIDVPTAMFDTELIKWADIKGGDPDHIIILNGVEVK